MDSLKLHVPYKENHWALWNWLANNPDKDKDDWPGWKTMESLGISIPFASCFLCEMFPLDDCTDCPLAFCVSPTRGGVLNRWLDTEDAKERINLAIQIRDCFVKA
jgi:hypothetical protein